MNFKIFLCLPALVALASSPLGAAETATGNYLSSQFARSNGDIDSAVRYLKKIHRQDSTNVDISGQLEGMLLLQGQVDEALVLADDIKKADGKDALADLLLTLREIKLNHPQQAMDMINAATESGRLQLWQPLLTAWLDLSMGKVKKPLTLQDLDTDATRAISLINYHLALVNMQAGFPEEATQNFKSAVPDQEHPSGRVMKVLLQFYEKNGSPEALTPLVKAYKQNRPEEDDENAIPAPVIANAQDGMAEVLFTMGGIMLGAGVTNDAAIYLQLALYLKPDFSDAALTLGDAYGELRQYPQANEAYARIPVSDRLFSKAQLHIAVNYDRMGKLDKALAWLDKTAKQLPQESDALITKGDLLRIHGRFTDAVEAYSTGLTRIPQLKSNHWPVLFARGSCYERIGKWNLAEADLNKALELKPDQPDVLNYLGYGLLEQGRDVEQARAMIEKAVKSRPEDPQIVDSMGWALYLLGEYAQAAEYLEKAVALLPGDPTVNDHLGDAYWRLGRRNEARFQWERSLSFSPEAKLTETINKKLKEGLAQAPAAPQSPPIPSASVTPPQAMATP